MKYITPQIQRDNKVEVHPALRQHHVTPINSPLYVVTTITNPQRYYTRYKLYQAFEKMCEDAGAILYTIELALRDRNFEITNHTNPKHIQLRSPNELWFKENLMRIATTRLPEDWQYIAFLDADISFTRPDWANEIIHLLQHYKVVQPFSHALDLGPDFQPLYDSQVTSFFKSFVDGKSLPYRKDKNSGSGGIGDWRQWHSGYGMCFRRSALSDLGGIPDIAILGSGDHHLCASMIGLVDKTIHGQMNQSYKKYWKIFQERALNYIDRNIGYMKGTIFHYFHGSKKFRRYNDRWSILVNNNFDYEIDLKRDVQGLWQFTNNKWKLKNQIQDYFKCRNEDDIRID